MLRRSKPVQIYNKNTFPLWYISLPWMIMNLVVVIHYSTAVRFTCQWRQKNTLYGLAVRSCCVALGTMPSHLWWSTIMWENRMCTCMCIWVTMLYSRKKIVLGKKQLKKINKKINYITTTKNNCITFHCMLGMVYFWLLSCQINCFFFLYARKILGLIFPHKTL